MKTMTEHAEVAKTIRKELKKNFSNTKFKVQSSGFAGGDDVRISWTDGPTEQEVNKIVSKYQYGSFDPMRDLYEITNDRKDITQVKYVLCQRTLSNEFVIEILKKNGFEATEEELDKTNKELFNKTERWTYRQLAQRLAQEEA